MPRIERTARVEGRASADQRTGPQLVRDNEQKLQLRLYVANGAPNSLAAEANLRALLAALPGNVYELEVVDCIGEPMRALEDGVIVTPTLLKLEPAPSQVLIGTLADQRLLATTLGLSADE